MIAKDCIATLISMKPGPVRDGMEALLRSMPEIEFVEMVDDDGSFGDRSTTRSPTLVLMDADLCCEADTTGLQQIRKA